MSSYRIFTRRFMGLDNRVWLTMLILSVFSILLLSYKLLEKEKCKPFSIKVATPPVWGDTIFYTQSNIFFESNSLNKNIRWTFGDKSGDVKNGLLVLHKFTAKGKYYVSASINGECETGKWITIENKPENAGIQKINSEAKEIRGPSSVNEGEEKEYFSPVLADSVYEWVVTNHPEMGKQTGEKAKFKFNKSGKYTIRLTLDNNRIKYYPKDVYVAESEKDKTEKTSVEPDIEKLKILKPKEEIKKEEPAPVQTPPPAPEPTKPAPPTIKYISELDFKDELQEFVNSEREENDFDRYLCSRGKTLVIINNDDEKPEIFSGLCQKLKKKKKTIKNVGLVRVNGCITRIDVKY